MAMKSEADQFDSPWKEALEKYLQPLLEFCFPNIADAIDWRTNPEFLDKELQEVVRDAALGKRRVDKLIKVQLLDGSQGWLLIHVEVQHRPDQNLPLRLYQYHRRLNDYHGENVLTLAILADGDPDWRPDHYERQVFGCRVRFDFPTCKLLDLTQQAKAEAAKGVPSAVIVLANWLAQQTQRKMAERFDRKWDLTRRLYDLGLDKAAIWELYRLIDWLMRLPEALEKDFKQRMFDYERSKAMPYVTSIERMAKQEGLEEGWQKGQQEGWQKGQQEGWQKGRQEGELEGQQKGQITSLQAAIVEVLQTRFGVIPDSLRKSVQQIREVGALTGHLQRAVTCTDLVVFQQAIGG